MEDAYAAALMAGDPQAGLDRPDSIPDDDLVDIEHEGQTYRVPAPLREAFLARADRDRQLQEIAAHREALARDRRGFDARRQADQASLGVQAQLAACDRQLAAFQQVDWEAFAGEDPEGARSLWAQAQALLQERQEYVYALAHHDERAQALAAQELSERLAETGRVLSQEIEGWSPEVATKLVEYAAAFGIDLEELREVADPRLWKILHRAYAGDELQKKQAAAENVAQAQAVRPAVQVAGSAAGSGGVRDELGTREWMRRRNEHMRRAG